MQQLSSEVYAHVRLWYLLQHSVSSFNKLLHYFANDVERATAPQQIDTWRQLGLHKNHFRGNVC